MKPYDLEKVTAPRKLREDTEVVLLPADKGKSTVVLDRVLYEEKVRDLLGSHAYEKLKKNLTSQVQRNLNKILAEILQKYPEAESLCLRLICRNFSAPGFYRGYSLGAIFEVTAHSACP